MPIVRTNGTKFQYDAPTNLFSAAERNNASTRLIDSNTTKTDEKSMLASKVILLRRWLLQKKSFQIFLHEIHDAPIIDVLPMVTMPS